MVRNEVMRVILGTTKDTSIEAVRHLLELPSIEARHKIEQVKAYFKTMQNPKNPLHDAVKEEKVMYGSSRTVNLACVQSRRAQAKKERTERSSSTTRLCSSICVWRLSSNVSMACLVRTRHPVLL